MSLPYMFQASIRPSSGVSPAVATCCHLVHMVLGVCPRASGSFDVVFSTCFVKPYNIIQYLKDARYEKPRVSVFIDVFILSS